MLSSKLLFVAFSCLVFSVHCLRSIGTHDNVNMVESEDQIEYPDYSGPSTSPQCNFLGGCSSISQCKANCNQAGYTGGQCLRNRCCCTE
uniref:Uncharacterized protein n=1 Tax=Nelumbo nucifera TaxID=4432 RepID=A0A822YBL4_NELNU|nr:TPA_asm: hypothetical protein HUJ06_030167 [Nelumbo nucifera]